MNEGGASADHNDPEKNWCFADFELSRQSGLRRDGEHVETEPKALDLLIYLVAHHERIIDKTELLDAIWHDEVVEEAALSQTVFKLRKALGDEARDPRFIATRHRRGYQFIAPLLHPQEKPVSATRSLFLTTAGLLLIAGIVFIGSLLYRTQTSDERAPPRLGFMPVESDLADTRADLLGKMFDDLLFSRLSHQKGLITRARGLGSMVIGSQPTDVMDYADEQQVDWVLRGKLAPGLKDDRVWLSMELIRIDDGVQQNFPLERFDLPLPEDDADYRQLLEARNRVAEEIGDYVGLAILRSTQTNHDPSSLESLRLALLAMDDLFRLSCGAQLPVQYMEEAVAIDPEFTFAWVLLGYAHFNQVWACGGDVSHLERAYEMAEKAISIEPTSVQALALEIQLLASLGRPDEALEKIVPAVRENPNSPMLNFYTGLLYNYTGLLDRSEAFLNRALALDPFLLSTDVSDPPQVLLYRGKWQRFLTLQASFDSSYHRFYRGYALWQLGDLDQARQVLGEFTGQVWQQDPFAAYGQSLLAIINHQPSRAVERVSATHDRRHGNGIRDGEMTFKEAWLMALAGRPGLALTYLETSVDEGFACNECIDNTPFAGLITDGQRLERLRQRIASRQQEIATRIPHGGIFETLSHQ